MSDAVATTTVDTPEYRQQLLGGPRRDLIEEKI